MRKCSADDWSLKSAKRRSARFIQLFCSIALAVGFSVWTPDALASCAAAPSGLVGWWKADANAGDVVSGNTGVLQNVGYTNGVVGQAFSFDPNSFPYGTYTGVQVPDQPAYALTNSLTIEGWVRPRGDGYVIFWRGDNRPGLDPYALSMQANHTLLFQISEANGNSASLPASLAYSQWCHVAATLDGGSGTMSIYTNGVLASQATTAIRPFGDLIAGDSPGVGIGNVNDGQNNFPFTGDIDEISLYNRALLPGEIQAIYIAGSAGKCVVSNPPPSCVAPPTGLVGWWKADANAGDVVSGNTGVLQNVGYTNGVVGQAFSFDPNSFPYGTYTGVQVPDQPAYALTNSLTIEGWVRPRGDGYVIFWRGDNRPGLDPYALSMQANHTLLFQISEANGNSASLPASLAYSQWCHVAATLDGGSGTMSIYTNGVLASQATTAIRPFGDLIAGDSPGVGIGNVNDGQNNFPFTGDIDEISLYNRALLPGEIQAIYIAGSAGKCVVSNPPPSCVAPPSGLVSWWKAESNALDQLGGNDGILSGNTTYIAGLVGTAFAFDGQGGYVSAGSSDSLRFTNQLSISAWIFPTGPGQHPQYGGIIVNKEGEYELARFADGTIGWAFANQGSIWTWLSSGAIAPLNQWTHVALTYDNGLVSAFLNGQLVQSNSGNPLIGDIYPDLNEFRIGNRQADAQAFAGLIDEVAVFSRALTANEVAAIYAAGSAGMCPLIAPTNCSPAPSGLVAWWPMQSNALDVVGGHNGTLAGTFSFTAGEVGLGLNASGTTAGASVADSPDLDFGPGVDFSIELWIQPVVADTAFGAMGLIDKRAVPNISQSMGYALAVGNGQFAFQMSDSLNKPFLQTGPAGPDLRDGAWHHVAVTVVRAAANGGNLYVDGQVVLTFDPTSQQGDLTTTAPLLLGLAPASLGLDTNLRGGLDEPSIYRRALMPAEILSIYNAGISGKCVVPILPVNDPPVPDASATRALVLSPNGTNATVVLDGSRSFDVDSDTLQYRWFLSGSTDSLATGIVAIVVLPVGTNSISLAVSDGIATATNTIKVEVITAAQAVERLVAAVNSDVSRSGPLIATLRAAIASIDRSNPAAAINQLQAFQNQIHAQLEPLDAEAALTLLQTAQEAIDALNNGTPGSTTGWEPQIRIENLIRQTDGKLRMKFSTPPGRIHVVAASTNMLDWELIGVAADLGDGTFDFEDTSATRFDTRFYRIISP